MTDRWLTGRLVNEIRARAAVKLGADPWQAIGDRETLLEVLAEVTTSMAADLTTAEAK